MRCTQVIGLNPQAQQLIATAQVIVYVQETIKTYSDGTEEHSEPQPVYVANRRPSGQHWVGMFDGEGDDLYIYTLSSGPEIEEFLQAQPWSSGPCIFLALRDFKTKKAIPESLWSDDDIANV